MRHSIKLMNNGKLNDYIVGRISGIIHVLTGMPDKGYPLKVCDDTGDVNVQFDCTDEQYQRVIETIDRMYGSMIAYNAE